MNQELNIKVEKEREFILVIDNSEQVRPKIEKEKNENKDEKVCKICDKKLSSKISLHQHEKVFHSSDLGLKVYFCDNCDLKFFNKNFLIAHLKSKHQKGKEIKFECDFDGKIFVTKKQLTSHMKCHCSAKKKCKICQEEYKNLNQHMRQVHPSNNEKVQCKICNKSFKNQQCLKIHLKSHNKQHQCRVCGRKFASIYYLKEHLKVHEDRFTFRCEKCQKNFNHSSNLRNHQKTHEQNRSKPHKCQQCDYASDKKEHFTNHLRTHDKNREKNFKCSKCDFKTDHKRNLKRHLQIHEPNRRKFPCLYCNYEANQRSHLTTHLKRKHDPNRIKNLKCFRCDYATNLKDNLNKHIKARHNKK